MLFRLVMVESRMAENCETQQNSYFKKLKAEQWRELWVSSSMIYGIVAVAVASRGLFESIRCA